MLVNEKSIPDLKLHVWNRVLVAYIFQIYTLTGSAVTHGGDPQDRAVSPSRVYVCDDLSFYKSEQRIFSAK
ncbi:hypothetical protein [Mastigocoleus sp. MO_188.B34]|uniref:hypothetical protein n=1 Tax=Mastigocoleus sp. MO_188.B34 TaxID=3036635 RepID=UPI002613A13B|nr:hypothetical protein [Mastigocoleus sp. MO_188.B34]MDJ0692907.1 hypothetical protein [Mastigocoleus sp. MO_188.B34]